MPVTIVVVVVGVMRRSKTEGDAQTFEEEAQSQKQHDDAGNQTDYGEEFFRQHIFRSKERHQSQRKDPERMRDGYGQA